MGGGAGGRFLHPNPKDLAPNQPLIPMTNGIVQEFADMLATIALSSADSVITKEEAKKIRARWEELKSVTEGFVQASEAGILGPPKPSRKTRRKVRASPVRGFRGRQDLGDSCGEALERERLFDDGGNAGAARDRAVGGRGCCR